MSGPRLVVEPSSIALRTSGPVTGDITLDVGGVVFPLGGWNDFVIVILESWISALVRLVRRGSDAERVHFMEGPYVVDMKRLNTGAIEVRALERPNRQRAFAQVMPLELVENAIGAGESVAAFCREHGHQSSDLDRLEMAVAALRQDVPSLTS
jgi:hypothetical protein